MAIMLGFKPEFHRNMIEKRILPYLKDEKATWPVPSAFWATYVMETMGRLGYSRESIDFIRSKWSPMLSTGTTWEGFDWKEPDGGSCSHAWTGHPSFHMVNMIAGLRQTGLAWSEVELAPSFIEGIDSAEAVVPSPKGPIKVSWRRRGGKIEVSAGIPAKVALHVRLPGISRKICRAGMYTFNI